MADNSVVADDIMKAVYAYEGTRPPRDGNCTGGLVGLAKFIARNFLKNESRWEEVYEFVKRRFRAGRIVQRTSRGTVSFWPAQFAPMQVPDQKRRPAYAF